MLISFDSLTSAERYQMMTQTIIPRPIAWVLSKSKAGAYNLAPFSYFAAVGSDPGLLMFSASHRKDTDEAKDTVRNIEEQPVFTVHIASFDLIEHVEASAKPLPYGTSEVEATGMQLGEFEGRPSPGMPRLLAASVAFHCKLYEIKELAGMRLVFGEVEYMHVDDTVMGKDAKGRPLVSASDLDPLARLGAGFYANLGEVCKPKKTL